jgi:arabinan endo-1,5-alpha-L-arabinosidase
MFIFVYNRRIMNLRKYIRLLVLTTFYFLVVFEVMGQRWPAGIHDPSKIVKCDDTYWVFGTGDGISSIYSKDMIIWQAGPTPFTKTAYPGWIKNYVGAFEGTFWAPDLIYMNGKYYLYYSCSEWGTMTSTIGCVTNKTLNPDDPEYKWVDAGFLGIWSYQPGLALNAIDPSLMRGPDGKIWMVYGSFNEQGIVVTEIDSVSGKPKTYAGNLPGTSIANSWTGPQSNNYGEGEGAAMIYRNGYYYLFYNKGGCCAGIASTYYMVMGRSTNPKGPFLDKSGKAMKLNRQTSGGTVVLKHDNSRGTEDRYFGPGHFGMYSENGVDYVTFHYYDPNGYYPNPAVNNQGGPTLGLAKLVWEEDGWPSISMDFVEKGVYAIENGFSKKVVDVSSQTLINGVSLFQYAADTTYQTQKWVFNALGSGEYAIHNYSNPEMYIEAGGTNNTTTLSMTSKYDGAVNQRFRTVTSPNGKTIIYPSTKDVGWGLPFQTDNDAKISLRSVTSHDFLRWNMIPFDETLFVSETKLTIEQTAGTNNDIIVESNGLWRTSVLYDTWLNIESSGVGSDSLKISFSENPDANDRKNRIYITSNGGISKIINITQTGKPTATGDLPDNDYFEIFPNPVSHEIFIKGGKNGMLSVYNQTGQKICDFNLETGKNRIDISDYKNGIYLFRIVYDNKSVVKKIIKN